MDSFLLTPYLLDRPEPLLRGLLRPGWRVNEPAMPGGAVLESVAALAEGIAEHVRDGLERGERPVSVAGDCLQVMGVMAGYQRAGREPWLVWLDAHGDFNTPQTSPSGFLGGMPLAMLVGRGERVVLDRLRLRPFDERRVVHCDGRDLDPLERESLEASAVHRLRRVEELAGFPFGERPVHLHLDPDLIDPAEAPAMLYPAVGGPGVAALAAALSALAAWAAVTSVSLTGWALDLDADGTTARAVERVLAAALAGGLG